MSLLASIPAPTRDLSAADAPVQRAAPPQPTKIAKEKEIPPYGQRKGYIPRKQEDYGGGEWYT